MNRSSRLLNLVCFCALVVGCSALGLAALRGEKAAASTPEIEVAAYNAVFAFTMIRDHSYDPVNLTEMQTEAWKAGLKASLIPGNPPRSRLSAAEEAIREDVVYLLQHTRRSRSTVLDAYLSGMARAADDGHTAFSPGLAKLPDEGPWPQHGLTLVAEDGPYRIFAMEADSPAFYAGLRIGDLVQQVWTDVEGESEREIKFTFDVYLGADARLQTRHRVSFPAIYPEPKDIIDLQEMGEILYVGVRHFSHFLPIYYQLKEQRPANPSPKMVIDLRNNPGGSPRAVAELLSELSFVGHIMTDATRDGIRSNINVVYETYFALGTVPMFHPQRIVVLTNKETSSAAEIATYVLRNALSATVVGTRSSGSLRGALSYILADGYLSVAESLPLVGDPGVDLDQVGVEPDIYIEQDYEALSNGRDNVLQRAIDLLSEP